VSVDPPRNFSLALEDRVRALGGPPAYMRRKRAIEDLEESLVRRVRAKIEAGVDPAAIAAAAARDIARDIARVNDLIARHNRYYPIEANLPCDPKTGQIVERPGRGAWAPLAEWSIERLLERARGRGV
jgi:hypothetical protein